MKTNVCIVEDEASGLKEDEDRINTRVPIDGTRQDYQLSNNDPKRSKPETIKSEVIRLLDLNGDGKIDQ